MYDTFDLFKIAQFLTGVRLETGALKNIRSSRILHILSSSLGFEMESTDYFDFTV
jgi:hypothetical protein